MTPETYDQMEPQSKKYVCDKHGVPLIKNMLGTITCPLCEWHAFHMGFKDSDHVSEILK